MHINNIDTFVNSHAHNVTLGVTSCEDAIECFNSKVCEKFGGYAGFDLGGVLVYAIGVELVAWVDYENMYGYIKK